MSNVRVIISEPPIIKISLFLDRNAVFRYLILITTVSQLRMIYIAYLKGENLISIRLICILLFYSIHLVTIQVYISPILIAF